MAKRIVFLLNDKPRFYQEREVEFKWTKGQRFEAVKANAEALREAALKELGSFSEVYEISRAGSDYSCFSAFRLQTQIDSSHRLPFEVVFQFAKVWEGTEPPDLLTLNLTSIKDSQQAKKYANAKREQNLSLRSFSLKVGEALQEFPLTPPDAFYNWLYIITLRQPHNKDWTKRLIKIADNNTKNIGFTDIRYVKKVKKQFRYNCQARAVAIFVSLYRYNKELLDRLIVEYRDLRSLLDDEPIIRFDEFVKSVYFNNVYVIDNSRINDLSKSKDNHLHTEYKGTALDSSEQRQSKRSTHPNQRPTRKDTKSTQLSLLDY